MSKVSVDYYQRKWYFEKEQVPTQSIIKEKMGKPLANVYFKSMDYKLKVLAGLEPPMKGGGSEWYMPPEEILKGRAVLKPENKIHLKKLTAEGFGLYTDMVLKCYHKKMKEEKQKVIQENELNWRNSIDVNNRQTWEDSANEAAIKNSEDIQTAFRQFETVYTTSISKIERILFDGAIKEIERIKSNAYKEMKKLFKERLKQQAIALQEVYDNRLEKMKELLKVTFISNVENSRNLVCNHVHDINVEKHLVIEKLRQLLKSQSLACQVYVALKEREECKKEIELAKHEHKKKIKGLREQIALTDFEIHLAQEKERKRNEFDMFWKKKLCNVVKRLQMFVSFCLNALPEYADFFIDMEKLMMLQLSNAVENPSAESIFVRDEDELHTPVSHPHPFYLFCDRGYKPQNIEDILCPKHCTSSSSQLPVIVVNKRFIYAACDNIGAFPSEAIKYLHGEREEDLVDFENNLDYKQTVPIKYTSQERLQEVKLESSLFQALQSEVPNPRELSVECQCCRIPYCFCSPLRTPVSSIYQMETQKIKVPTSSLEFVPSGNKLDTRSLELIHEREPKIESYLEYVTPKKCMCGRSMKKHLEEHLPPYMRMMSKFETPRLPDYKMCPLEGLRKLVQKAQRKRPPTSPRPIEEPTLRSIGTQFSDQEYDSLCDCLSDDEVYKLIKELKKGRSVDEHGFKVVGDEIPHSYLSRRTSSVAMECAHVLRATLNDSPRLEEIFRKKDCNFD